MKIKQTRHVRLDELLKYVWNNNINDTRFESDNDSWVRVDEYGDVVSVYSIEKSDLFVITEEVEITEEMELKQLIAIYKNNLSGQFRNMNIKELVERHKSFFGNGNPIKFIYSQNEDGTFGELIWSKERGLNATNTEI
ncbi:hypothetical protein [Macrococcus animalis]|uniref:hypothetical protein n=1 Tax=Macrococcus animalis TaxID=3395467 RepID=UPI0039BE6A7F